MKYTYRPTGKNHVKCGGKILESFAKKSIFCNNDIPKNSAPGDQIVTTGFYCEKCGQAFGGPLFRDTEILFELGNELLFELSYQEIVLKRKLTSEDIPFSIGDDLIKKALKMKAGDILYFSYTDKNNNCFHDQSFFAGFVRLEPKGNSPLFTLSKDAFEFR
ncbi:MAG TPA: hypothetical protein PLQ20_01385 [Candidatus Paceibacterota bacterium]|nr:hypothetical protein [Candidatus Paceibacterota bacterium]